MPVRLGRFEMPKQVVCEEATATSMYAKFIAEPFEAGYGHTIGSAMRRVLLSSLEGAAITSVKIEGAPHEFTSIPGVVEDVTDIVLNLKKVLLQSRSRDSHIVFLSSNKEGAVTASDIKSDQIVEVINPDQHICTLGKKMKLEAELEVKVGRGFCPAEENKKPDQPIGVIAIDSLFSPVRRVRYAVENTRVGQRTDYDKLLIEVWTDGRIKPRDAFLQASNILRHHLDLFCELDKTLKIEFEEASGAMTSEQQRLKKVLNMSVNEIELSVRAANCLNNANITTVGQLAMKTESDMLKYRNFGKKSLSEIREKLTGLGLTLGMRVDSALLEMGPKPQQSGDVAEEK